MGVILFDELCNEPEEVSDTGAVVVEASTSTKLERRRKIEDLAEERRLRNELAEFG
jgi:hypothetical protein